MGRKRRETRALPLPAFVLVLAALLAFDLAPAHAQPAANPQARRHALLIVVGQYPGAFPRMPGAAHDVEHARALVRVLDVPEDQVTLLRDHAAAAEGIRRAAADLALRLAPSDQVLVYFSGLGSHRADLDRPGTCEETFIAGDGVPLGHGELAHHFLAVAERAEKTLVVFDSCNGDAGERPGLVRRCIAPPAGEECGGTAARRWRGFVNELRKSSVSAANVVAVAAAAPGEAAYADTARGSLFGSALPRCLAAESSDRDRSGAISIGEIGNCARQLVEQQVKVGKGEMVDEVAKVAEVEGAARPAFSGNRAFAPRASRQGQGKASTLLEDLYAGRDGRRQVVLEIKGQAGPGAITLRSMSVGYLYLIAADPSGGFRLLFPNPAERENRLRAGATFAWPVQGVMPALPRGAALLAIVADNERDLAQLPPAGAWPADAAGRERLYRFVTTSIRSGSAPCRQSGAARNLSLARGCSDAYGAALIAPAPN